MSDYVDVPVTFISDRVNFQAPSGQSEPPQQVISFKFGAIVLRATACQPSPRLAVPRAVVDVLIEAGHDEGIANPSQPVELMGGCLT